ncbi:hypothetical protein ACFX5L_02030 [Bacteroides sp. KG123]|uniref:hypothetical protein n=1 Tax=unclassified Bacteroides TaxID=2646097 RepID=UPI003D7F8D3B
MKRQTNPILCLTGALLFLSASLSAQDKPTGTSSLEAHIGPAWYTGHLMGITSRADDYCNSLRKGIGWDIGYWYTGKTDGKERVILRPGFIYQGSRFEEKQANGSDKILLNYLAPQIGLFFLRNNYRIQLSAGAGYQFYMDKSVVYDKPRKVSMDKPACNFALAGEYLLTRRWGVSARCNWVLSDSERYSVVYYGEHWKVEHPDTGEGCFGQLSLTFGLNYHF